MNKKRTTEASEEGITIMEVLVALSLSIAVLGSTQASNSSLLRLLKRLETKDAEILKLKNSAQEAELASFCKKIRTQGQDLTFKICEQEQRLGTAWSIEK